MDILIHEIVNNNINSIFLMDPTILPNLWSTIVETQLLVFEILYKSVKTN